MREITELLYNLSPGTVIYTEKDPVYEYIEITKYINGYYRCFTSRGREEVPGVPADAGVREGLRGGRIYRRPLITVPNHLYASLSLLALPTRRPGVVI